jgi:leader peptidase (prepilin peptidase)/N-methyltransferase
MWVLTVLAGVLLAGVDVRCGRLPTRLVGLTGVAVVGVLGATAVTTRHMALVGDAVLAAGVVGLAYLLVGLLCPGQLGLGDVRLAALRGLPLGATGWTVVTVGVVLPYVLAVPVAVHGIVSRRRCCGRGDFAFGPYLVAGAVVGVLVAG